MEIDLNADLGEGFAYDAELLTLVSSASISCGAHAGEEADIRAALRLATEHGVRIGAHPSYPDRRNMGRKVMAMPADELEQTLLQQLGYLHKLAAETSARLTFVKPHGALYNEASRNPALATHLARTVKAFDPALSVVGMAGSELLRACHEAGVKTCAEAFVDRAYQADGSLLPRTRAGAILTNTELAVQQAVNIITEQRVQTHDGKIIDIVADTLCIHGDTPQAVAFAKALRAHLGDTGIVVRACL